MVHLVNQELEERLVLLDRQAQVDLEDRGESQGQLVCQEVLDHLAHVASLEAQDNEVRLAYLDPMEREVRLV